MDKAHLEEFIDTKIDKNEYIDICCAFIEENEILDNEFEVMKAIPFDECLQDPLGKGYFEDLEEYNDPVDGFWKIMEDSLNDISYDKKLFISACDEPVQETINFKDRSHDKCKSCTGEDCACCEIAHGF